MTDIVSLLAQREEINRQIAAQKPQAVAQVKQLMQTLGVTLEDLGAGRAPKASGAGSKRPVKYRDDAGNTWTGVGQRPRWLVAALQAGKTLSDFAVAS